MKHLIPLQVLNSLKNCFWGFKFEEDVRLLIFIINWREMCTNKIRSHTQYFWSGFQWKMSFMRNSAAVEKYIQLPIWDFINIHIWNRKIIFSQNYYKLKNRAGVQEQHPQLVWNIYISSYTQLTINVFLWANLRMLLPIWKRNSIPLYWYIQEKEPQTPWIHVHM